MTELRFPEITNPKQRAFLIAFRETGNVRLACEAAGVGRSSHYRWLDGDPIYQEAFEEAQEDACDTLEAAAVRRAVVGVQKPAGWYRGKAGGTITEYSDNLLMFLLKGNRPEKYADRVELRGAMANIDLTRLPDHLLERIANGEHPLAVLASAQPEQMQYLPASDGSRES